MLPSISPGPIPEKANAELATGSSIHCDDLVNYLPCQMPVFAIPDTQIQTQKSSEKATWKYIGKKFRFWSKINQKALKMGSLHQQKIDKIQAWTSQGPSLGKTVEKLWAVEKLCAVEKHFGSFLQKRDMLSAKPTYVDFRRRFWAQMPHRIWSSHLYGLSDPP